MTVTARCERRKYRRDIRQRPDACVSALRRVIIERIARIRRHSLPRHGVHNITSIDIIPHLGKVDKSYHIARIIKTPLFVGHPDLYFLYLNPRTDQRQLTQRFIIAVIEIFRKEEVAIGFILVGSNLKILSLSSSFYLDGLRLSFPLREHCRDIKTPKFQISTEAEQALTPRNERPRKGHRDVSRLNLLDNFVFVPSILYLDIRFKVKRSLCVILHVKTELISNLPRKVDL